MSQWRELATSAEAVSVEAAAADPAPPVNDDTWRRQWSQTHHRSLALDEAFKQYLDVACDADQVQALLQQHSDLRHSLCELIRVHRLMAEAERPAWDWPEPGQHFAGLRLIDELGRGGLSRVYLAAQDTMGGRAVALKVAPACGDEAQILGPLSHRNIVPVYSREEDAQRGLAALCMPFEGAATLGSLLDLVASGQPLTSEHILAASNLQHLADHWNHRRAASAEYPDADPQLVGRSYAAGVVRLARQLADALAYTHGLGIAHNDIKPSNVLLTPSGVPKLMDFNLSSARNATEDARVGGTLPYMAPERIDELFHGGRRSERPDLADVYSLGVVMYQLLCGVNPLDRAAADSSSPRAAARAIRDAQAQAFGFRESAWRQIPPPLQHLVRRCLACREQQRPSAAELAELLDDALIEPPRAAFAKPQLWAAAVLYGLLSACWMGGDAANPDAAGPRSSDYLIGRQACQAGDFESAAAAFERAYAVENDPRCLAWKLYCLLWDQTRRHEADFLFQRLAELGYRGEELRLNFATFASYQPSFAPSFIQRELDGAVAARPDLVIPRIARANYCAREACNTPAIDDYGCQDIEVALRMAGEQADLGLWFIAAKVYARAIEADRTADADASVLREARFFEILRKCDDLGLRASYLHAILGVETHPLLQHPAWDELQRKMQPNQRRIVSPQYWAWIPPRR